MGFTNFFATSDSDLNLESQVVATNILSKDESNSNKEVIQSEESVVVSEPKITSSSIANVKANQISFPGLDKKGTPIGFTITDSSGSLGALYFNGKEALISDSGITFASIAKTARGAANVFLNQVISQEVNGITYDVILSYGRGGNWVPLVSKVISVEIERQASGNYLLTATIQVKSEVETPIVIPASTDGQDLEVSPNRVITRILLNPSKTIILAQAVQVVERVV